MSVSYGVDSGYGGDTSPEAQFTAKRSKLLSQISTAKSLLSELKTLCQSVPNASGSSDDENVLSASQSLAILTRLDNKSTNAINQHLDNLYQRIADTTSRVLVTGDLNAGKSTFVNALLRREVVPDDQQPCTALFAEVVDVAQNYGVEEVHGIKEGVTYDKSDPNTFDRMDIRHLRTVVEDNEGGYELLKVYCGDDRGRNGEDGNSTGGSLLHNGAVDISLIDSPGLNIDVIKTMALFSKQETIDVIVFVVNAENHFTLSGREFLTTAGKEKAYIFIVVNKYDQIRRKERCRRDIMDQIKEISPQTYSDPALVHFVSAKQRLLSHLGEPITESPEGPTIADFTKLEESLRSFILEKRLRSKLAPAKTYLSNLLSDMTQLAASARLAASQIRTSMSDQLAKDAPNHERMLQLKASLLDNLDRTIDDTATIVRQTSALKLNEFMERMDLFSDGVEWSGAIYVWQYATTLRNTVYRGATQRLRRCEEFAKRKALECVETVQRATEGLEEAPRIDPSIIYSAFDESSSGGPGEGLKRGISMSDSMTDFGNNNGGPVSSVVPMELEEFFDYQDRLEIVKDYVPSMGMIAAGAIGFRVMSGPSTGAALSRSGYNGGGGFSGTKLLFAGLSVAGVGLFLYVLSDMKHMVDRKVLGKMRQHLTDSQLIELSVDRLVNGTRRVLRLSFWEFQNHFQRLLGESTRKRDEMRAKATGAEKSAERLEEIARRLERCRKEVEAVELEE
ncbi:P-loop containing nucleoside triphosphate hydrolase protein [Cladochytrium replicatum]|nr:P-loop containing nucleoside triphosphate hydrolase protein [Cladochytrium replicatum]